MSNNVQICTCHTVSQADCPFHASYAIFNHPTDMINTPGPTPETDNCARVYEAAGMPAAYRALLDSCRKLEQERPDLKEHSMMIEKLIAERDKANELLSHFVTHYEALDYSEATLDELEKVAVSLWGIVKERDQLRKVADALAEHRKLHNATHGINMTPDLQAYNSLPHVQQRNKK